MSVIDIYVNIPVEGNSNVMMTYQVTSSNHDLRTTSYLLSEFQHMDRPYDEFVVKSMRRLALNCKSKLKRNSKKEKKKERHKINETENCISTGIIIKYDDQICNVDEMRNFDLISDMLIYVDSFCFKVIKNAPNITSLSTYPKLIITYGCMIIPLVDCEFANDFQCVWLCENYPKSNDYIIVSKDKHYTPSCAVYIGCRIKLFCNPIYRDNMMKSVEGKPVVYYLSGALQPAIPILNKMLHIRHDYNKLKRVITEENLISTYVDPTLSEILTRSCKELRVVSYNILAEPYATSTQAIKTLFRYCDLKYLQTEYRIQRVLLELLNCDADIICLQECDYKVFQTYLLPILGSKGYSGHFTSKSGLEGCALFTYNFTCQVKKYIDLPLKNVLRTAPYLAILYTHRPDLRDIMGGKLGTICQLAVIQSVECPSKQIIVANTHLFYHPLAGAIRLLQLYAITQAIEKLMNNIQAGISIDELHIDGEENIDPLSLELEYNIQISLKEYCAKDVHNNNTSGVHMENNSSIKHQYSSAIQKQQQSLKPSDVSVILVGDFNSTPETAAIEFLTKGFVSTEKWVYEWNRLQEFYWGESPSTTIDEEKHFTNNAYIDSNDINNNLNSMNLKDSLRNNNKNITKNNNLVEIQNLNNNITHRLNLLNASGYPRYSNYTADFKELLDYILISKHSFKVIRLAPFPEEDVLTENIALPSKVFPSDHLAIMLDIEYI